MRMLKKLSLVYLLSIIYIAIVIGLECYTCDSAEDAECATRPGQQIEVEECLKENDECVTVITNGQTRRGCLSRLFPNNYCPDPCDRCNSSLCNRDVFPLNRLRCYQCVGAACANVTNRPELVLPCPVYHEKDRCYTNVIRVGNTQRGCEYTDLPKECPNICLKCDYNGCNNEPGQYEHPCYSCTSNSNSPDYNCLRNQQVEPEGQRCSISAVETCFNKVLYGHKGKCFLHVNEQTGVVQRGCSSNMGFYPTGSLTECYGDKCNDACLPIKCNNCTNKDNPVNCALGLALRPQKCDDNTFSCYSCEQGASLRRGCADRPFQPQSPQEACYLCRSADGCNRQTLRSCFHCSSLEHSDCNLLNDPLSVKRANCSSANELCVTTLLHKFNLDYTVRGCASHVLECTENDPFCVRCNGSLCNDVPVHWPQLKRNVKLLRDRAIKTSPLVLRP